LKTTPLVKPLCGHPPSPVLFPFPQEKKHFNAFLLFQNSGKICSISTVRRSRVNTSRASEVTPLIKQDIVHHVIERTGLPRTKAEAAVDTVFEGLKAALAAGERIELRGFGVFSVRARKTGIGRNPRTGTEVSIAPGKAVRFKPGKELHSIETGGASNA
jgi:DNA-binding protein HU-beta